MDRLQLKSRQSHSDCGALSLPGTPPSIFLILTTLHHPSQDLPAIDNHCYHLLLLRFSYSLAIDVCSCQRKELSIFVYLNCEQYYHNYHCLIDTASSSVSSHQRRKYFSQLEKIFRVIGEIKIFAEICCEHNFVLVVRHGEGEVIWKYAYHLLLVAKSGSTICRSNVTAPSKYSM